MLKKVIYLILLILFVGHYSRGQDIERLKDQEPFTIHGGIGGGTNFFSSNQDQATRAPFSWNLYGRLTPTFYGFAIPLSFSVTQYSESYTTPFSRFGIAPTYKWIKLHLGYSHISFSPLVFDGQSFLGAGVELHPGSFYFGAFYGRLNKAISEDSSFDRHVEPQYGRKGYGIKVGIENEKTEFTLQFFHAEDDTGSIHRYYDSLSTILPQSNSVLGSSWKFTFFNKLTFSGNAAASLLNRDLSYEAIDSVGDTKIPSFVKEVAPVTYSAVLNWSAQAQLALMLRGLNAVVGYRRVEPDYKSLGVPYALDDIEMITGNVGTSLNKGKISLNAAFTSQHNNLNHKLSSTLVSRTGNLSVNTFISQHFNLNMNLTGVRVLQNDGLIKLTDSTRMDQTMMTFVLAPSFNFAKQSLQHSVSGSFTYTSLLDHNPATQEQTNGKNLSASANYSLYFLQKYFGLTSGIMYSSYKQKNSTYSSLGLNVGANTQLLKSRNLMVQGSVGYFLNKASESPTGNNLTFSFNCNYSMKSHHSFGLFASYVITPPVELNPLNKIYRVPYAINSKILSGGVTYSYNF